MSDPLIGRKLGDYTIQAMLGRGGMSRVYRGYDENLDRYAAVKVISGDFVTTTEEEYTRRFQIEARAIARLRHPNIVGIYQFGRTEGIYYMAMVFLEGRDLRALLKEYADRGKRIPTDDLLHITRDIASALDYAHEQGVIHRDIKPSNVMLEKNTGRAILMDFGLALSVAEGTTGDTFGSAHYIAPEQAVSSAKAVPQSDLYSLGIVLYEMLTGKVPFDDPSAMSVALKHLNELPPPPSMFNPDMPPAVEAVIMRVLDKDPNRRYPTGFELVKALERAFETMPEMENRPSPFQTSVMPRMPVADSHPSSPDRPTNPLANFNQEPEGVAGRFARRKAHKEEQAALQAMTEDSLQIDSATLDSILGTYADPSDIGLVGPGATGISRPSRPPDSMLRAEAQRKRRSRIGLVLTTVLILIVVTAAAWFGFGNSKNKEDSQAAVGTEGSGQAVAVATSEATGEAASEVTPEATTEPVVTTEPEVTEVAIEPVITAEITQAAAETAEVLPTEEVSPTSSVDEAATATAVAAQTITSQQTADALAQTATASAQAEVNPSETKTPPPSSTPYPPTATKTLTLTPTPESNLRMIYDNDTFVLINTIDGQLNVNDLVFEQERRDGTRLVFEANTWDKSFIVEKPSRMGGHGCYQIVTSVGTQDTPSRSVCPRFLGWYRINDPDRYFWIGSDEGATFTVRVAGDPTVLATCSIAAGDCSFYLP